MNKDIFKVKFSITPEQVTVDKSKPFGLSGLPKHYEDMLMKSKLSINEIINKKDEVLVVLEHLFDNRPILHSYLY